MASVPELLRSSWSEVESKESPIFKYNFVRIFATGEKIDKGTQIYQDAELLIRFRNYIVHNKPQWNDEQEELKLFKALKGRIGFTPNQFTKHWNTLYFPHQCFGHTSAQWAFKSSVGFINDFYAAIGSSKLLDITKTQYKTTTK